MSAVHPIDHLVYTCPELEEGVRRIEALLGVTAAPGGRHDGLGTHNALVGLGPRSYLEIVAPDPDQPEPARPRWFGLDEPTAHGLVAWATPDPAPAQAVAAAAALDLELGDIVSGSRARPDGSRLSWTFTDPRAARLGGVVPFFIDWGRSAHPGAELPCACTVASLSATHPEPDRAREVLEALGVRLDVSSGDDVSLAAVIDCPAGRVELA